MSEYESLRKDLDGIADGMKRYADAVGVFTEVSADQIKALWKDTAELRDELHALANRVETLTRARLTEPAETASKMVDYDQPVSDLRGDVRPERYRIDAGETHS